jgi:hypothetical protein
MTPVQIARWMFAVSVALEGDAGSDGLRAALWKRR